MENKYLRMNYRRAGDSGLYLPEIALGLWHNFGINLPYDNMRDMVLTAFENGITYFDLANNYGPTPGEAETIFGTILKNDLSSHRHELVITTKAGYKMWDGPYGDNGSRKYLISSCEESLERLGLSYVDIFYHHRMDKNTPLEETMGALEDIVRSGKALYVGLSNYDGPTLEKATQILEERHVPFIVNQNRYSMLDRTIESNGLLEMTYKLKKGLVCFSPLAQGLLTDKYLNGIPNDSRVRTDGRFLKEKDITPEKISKIKKLNEIAKNKNMSLADMALAWVLSKKEVTSVIIGASNKEQILENVKAIKYESFTNDELIKIDSICNS